jgi:hypothetical protein
MAIAFDRVQRALAGLAELIADLAVSRASLN